MEFVPCGRAFEPRFEVGNSNSNVNTVGAFCSDGRLCPHCEEITRLREVIRAYEEDEIHATTELFPDRLRIDHLERYGWSVRRHQHLGVWSVYRDDIVACAAVDIRDALDGAMVTEMQFRRDGAPEKPEVVFTAG